MKFGVIGTNWITDKLIDAGMEIEGFELVAVYSRAEETAKKFAEKYAGQPGSGCEQHSAQHSAGKYGRLLSGA